MQIKTRTKGKVVQGVDGKFYWWAEFSIENYPDVITVTSNVGPEPKTYDTYEQALAGLKDCGKFIQKNLMEIAGGPKNLVFKDNFGSSKI